jgi:lipid-A-disaccharide synthase
MSHSILIIAGESSGDLHGASLARALREREPDITLFGLGSHRMREAGVEVAHDVTPHAAVGVSEVVASLSAVRGAYLDMIAQLDRRRPDAAVLLDYPVFNLGFARHAHRRGIPVIYYISPQIWAWRQGRVRKIARRVDRLLVILPFEPAFYARHRVEARFVGHPLLDILAGYRHDRRFAEEAGLPTGRFILGLLPGSRKREIGVLLPTLLAAAERIDRELGGVTVAIPPAPSVPPEEYESWQKLTSVPLHIRPGRTYPVMAAADLVIVASGTATLEAGIIGTPMIVVYKLSRLTWLLGRLLVRGVRFCSLPNLIAGREVVPELLQRQCTPDNLARRAIALARSGLAEMADDLAANVRPRLGQPGASARAADEILDLLHQRSKPASRQSWRS